MKAPLVLALAFGGGIALVAASPSPAPPMTVPESNPQSDAKVQLGRQLFYDTILSRDRSVSCASCHRQEKAFADGQPVSPGVTGKLGTRNAISLGNVGYRSKLLWEGASPSLELQAMVPLTDHNELDMTEGELVARLNDEPRYAQAFQEVFGEAPSMTGLVRALASFQRTLVTFDSAYDRYQRGDETALTLQQVRGFDVFMDKAECFHCHAGRDFTDGLPHNNANELFNEDLGLAKLTDQDADVGKFVTPSLRNVVVTGPYMHDGSSATLKEVVERYNLGGESNLNADPLLRPLGLTEQEVDDLVAFLEGLTDESFLKNPAFSDPFKEAK